MKTCGMTVQMKPFYLYFYMVLFIFQNFKMKFGNFCWILPLATLGSERVKATIALPFHSSLTTLVVQWWKKSARKVYCTFRVFALLIKPVSLFIFLVSFVVLVALSSLVASLRKTILDMRLFCLKNSKNRRFDGKWEMKSILVFLSFACFSFSFSPFDYRFPLLLYYQIM